MCSFKSLKKLTVGIGLLSIILLSYTGLRAQEIDFGSYSSLYSVSITEQNPATNLDFGTLIQNEGQVSIDITNSKIFLIEGVKYLDVLVEVTADDALLLNGDLGCVNDPSCSIPFNLQAAYANRGSNLTSQAIIMNVANNLATAQFPVQYRGTNAPGPPPTPVYEGYNPATFNETAYLYIYGSLNVGAVNAGSYTANITITVSYD